MIRRLDPVEDEHLFLEAQGWLRDAPEWFRQADGVFGDEKKEQISIGVFDKELIGIIGLVLHARGIYEAHLSARPKADVEKLARAAFQIREQLEIREGFAWVSSWNRGAIRVCELAGLRKDGITVLKGQARGRIIEWVRLSCKGQAHAVI